MRLFVAIDPPHDAIEHLRHRLDLVPGLRWTDPEQWHLTLTFCGEVDEKTAAELSLRLARAAARQAPVSLRLAGSGAFSRPARAHALWVGLKGEVDSLGRLAASASAAARRCAIAVEDRRFRAHLTIARAAPAKDLRELVAALSSYDGPTWVANEIHLVRSHLGAKTVHERIGTWRLAAVTPTDRVRDAPGD
ncbi:MAG: RNA 2',3'-cyclic phosphodiesterase [Actinomycetes bacterium]